MKESLSGSEGGVATRRGVSLCIDPPCIVWSMELPPHIERSLGDFGGGNEKSAEGVRPFRRVLSETWSYPSWLFKDTSATSSIQTSISEPDLRMLDEQFHGLDEDEDTVEEEDEEDVVLLEGGESEDEGWYSLSRTDVRKLSEVHLSIESTNINQESSQEINSYSSLSSGDSGQLSSEEKKIYQQEAEHKSVSSHIFFPEVNNNENKQLKAHCDIPSCDEKYDLSVEVERSSSAAAAEDESEMSSSVVETGTGHKIRVYVKYEDELQEGCVDSEGELDGSPVSTGEPCENTISIVPLSDTVNVCNTRVRLRLCSSGKKIPQQQQAVPVKRKDLFKMLGLNESTGVLDPSSIQDARKLALRNFLTQKTDTLARTGQQRRGRKNLAKFLGIELPDVCEDRDCELVSISTDSSGRKQRPRSGLLKKGLPGIQRSSRSSSLEVPLSFDIPEQLRTPKQPQVNRKDLQRFLGLNDCEEMVYIRNVRKFKSPDTQAKSTEESKFGVPKTESFKNPGLLAKKSSSSAASGAASSTAVGAAGSTAGGAANREKPHDSISAEDLKGTMSSACSCLVCSTDFPGNNSGTADHSDDSGHSSPPTSHSPVSSVHSQPPADPPCTGDCATTACLVCQKIDQKCTNEKCIMCTTLDRPRGPNHSLQDPAQNLRSPTSKPATEAPPLPKKTVAPFQEYKFGFEEPMPSELAVTEGQKRKKNATKRMEQILRIHTDRDAKQEQGMKTLDKKRHKRSILKQGGREDYVDMTRTKNSKVKFSASLRRKEQGRHYIRRKTRPCQVHFPFHQEYIDMRHILAVVDPRLLRQ